MGWYENYEKAETEARMKTCPVCGKRFLPAPQHAWQIGYESEIERNRNLVCTYSCMRKWEKEHLAKKKEKKHQGPTRPIIAINIETREEEKFISLSSASQGTGVSLYFIKAILTGKLTDKDGYKFKDYSESVQNFGRKSTPVIAININTGEETKFNSINAAARKLNLHVGNVTQVLHGNKVRTGRYTFKKCE